jgi:hypothetical protein
VKLEQLLAQVNAAKKRLATVSLILRRFRQAVLAAACSGRLTADWRESHQDMEPASESTQRIVREDTDDLLHETIYGEIPSTWGLNRLGILSDVITKGSSPNWQGIRYVNSGILFITSENVGPGYLILKNKKYVENKFNEIERRSVLIKGDLLTNIVGASIGRTAIYDLEEKANINQAVAVIRLKQEVNKLYVLLVLNSPKILDFMQRHKVDVARANISLKDVFNFPIPTPPFEEQSEIVRCVEVLFKLAGKVEKRVTSASTRANILTQGILAKAFRGELVPTEAELARHEGRSYESASALLSRIKAEHKAKEDWENGKPTSPKKR